MHKLSTKQSQGHKNTIYVLPSCPNLRRLRMAGSRQPESLARPLVVEDPLYSPPGGHRHGRNLRDSAMTLQHAQTAPLPSLNHDPMIRIKNATVVHVILDSLKSVSFILIPEFH